MRWQDGRRSKNINDRRGARSSPRAAGGGGLFLLLRFLPMMLRSKFGRIILLVGVVVIFGGRMLGIDVLPLLTGGGSTQLSGSGTYRGSPEEEELADFTSVILGETELAWHEQFQQMGRSYQEPKLTFYTDSVSSACGFGQAAMGPFYCPGDKEIYIDLSFFRDLQQRYNAPGDFARAYVIAHEVGHHVQTLLGISAQVRAQQQQVSEAQANELSVRQELQADCLAGVWGHVAANQRKLLEEGELQDALAAAAAIGDDRLQQQGRGYVVPESFTHGTSAQRMRWFERGFKSGKFEDCDTFSPQQL